MSSEMFLILEKIKYCTKCHSLEPVTFSMVLNTDPSLYRDGKLTASVFDMKSTNKDRFIDMHCKLCNSLETTILDNKIAPIVTRLNQKGYKTLFSCEGHNYDENVASYPYISFIGNVPANIFLTLPNNWFLDCSLINDPERLEDSIDSAGDIYYDITADDPNRDNVYFDVQAMLDWVNSLPDNE